MHRITHLKNQLSHSQSTLRLQLDDEYATITLNQPFNLLSQQLLSELSQCLHQLQTNGKVKLVVIESSSNKCFSVGVDIKQFENIKYDDQLNHDILDQLRQTLQSFDKPIVAAVNGLCLGGGFELALWADIIIATQDVQLGLPEMAIGLMPGLGGTQRLSKLIGVNNASYYIYTQQRINATQALQMGIVQKLCKDKQEMTQALKTLVQAITKNSKSSLISGKMAIRASQEGLNQGMNIERYLFNGLFGTESKKQGVNAFINKKKSEFKGI